MELLVTFEVVQAIIVLLELYYTTSNYSNYSDEYFGTMELLEHNSWVKFSKIPLVVKVVLRIIFIALLIREIIVPYDNSSLADSSLV